MNRVWSSTVVVAGLVLTLGRTSSWGGPPNPTASDAQGNTAGGTNALLNNASGFFNTAFGFDALLRNITGSGNTASGVRALFSNTTGSNNTASGFAALLRNTTGFFNTASGVNALSSNTTGFNNTASGAEALFFNTTGANNTASGFKALAFNTIGRDNTASGVTALLNNTTGAGNTAVGRNALFRTTTGSSNIAVGLGAGATLTSGSNNIYLGHPGAASESNTLRLGNVQSRTFIAGIAGSALSGSPVFINSSGQVGIMLSSARYKRDIDAMGARSRGLFRLRPVTFRYKQDAQGLRQYGLIAEEVAKVYPELVVWGTKGEVESVQYQELIPMLLNELQHQQQALAELRAQNGSLRAVVGQLQERDAAQRAQSAALAARLGRLEEGAARAAALANR